MPSDGHVAWGPLDVPLGNVAVNFPAFTAAPKDASVSRSGFRSQLPRRSIGRLTVAIRPLPHVKRRGRLTLTSAPSTLPRAAAHTRPRGRWEGSGLDDDRAVTGRQRKLLASTSCRNASGVSESTLVSS